MANTELNKFKAKKKVTKAGLTRMENFMNDIDPDTVDTDKIKLRLSKLEEIWQSFVDIQTELSVLDENMTDELMEVELKNHEDRYIAIKLKGERILKQRVRPAINEDNLDQAVGIGNETRRRNDECNVRLPKIDLPTFSGAYEDWYTFFNSFNSMIHSNVSLNDIQRFHYLKSS